VQKPLFPKPSNPPLEVVFNLLPPIRYMSVKPEAGDAPHPKHVLHPSSSQPFLASRSLLRAASCSKRCRALRCSKGKMHLHFPVQRDAEPCDAARARCTSLLRATSRSDQCRAL
jgi:hypothetical protein